MNTLLMAFKNLRKNFSYYALYLFSVALVITVFFAFTSFSMNQVMLDKISENGRVESMCNVISVCLMVFVMFFMAYSNRFFLKRRTKELGIYALLGYQKITILSLLIFENIFICCGALGIGLVLGAFAHKGIVVGITAFLKLSVDSSKIPFFNIKSIERTLGFILLVLLVLCISNGRFLLQTSLMNLIRFEKKAEKNMEFHYIPALLGFLMTLFGYGLSLDILRGRKSVWFSIGFYPVGMLTAILITIGTIFFISSFLPYVMEISKENKAKFYARTKIITIPSFIYRIRSNSQTLIMLTLFSASTLTISSIMALSLYYPIAAVSRMAPSELEFRIEKESQIDEVKQLITHYTPKSAVIYTQTDIYKITSPSNNLPIEYGLGTSKGDSDNQKLLRAEGFECISYSQYISLLQAQEREEVINQLPELDDNGCILIKYQPYTDGRDEAGKSYCLAIGEEQVPVSVKKTTLENPISFANSVGTLIVSDAVYEQIRLSNAPKTSVLSINGKAIENQESLFEEISELLDGSPYLQGHTHRINEIFSLSSSTFLLIGFLVVLFFIATGSILYFNNLSSFTDSKADYEILGKMGYTEAAIRKIIKKQITVFFRIPFLFGVIDCLFATIVFKTGLMQNILKNTIFLYIPTMIAMALTAVIYLIYYWLTVRSCCKIIFKR